ncbi:MAG TPA: response regulator transcription factor [Verrucomicrobiae bacterium]|jgi:DNA-binding NarL/FixJ family response regulator
MNKILIIEDQAQMRRKLAMILEREHFRVTTAPNGLIGLDLARSNPPDLVICDIMMPELDGYEVLEALRADKATATIPFIFLPAKGERVDQRNGMCIGADDYLTKPVQKDDLLNSIHARLKRRDREEQRLKEKLEEASFNPQFDAPARLEALGPSPREAEILNWLAQGKSNAEIGLILNISVTTVKKHLVHIYEKLGVESRHAATLRALEVLARQTSQPAPPSPNEMQ